MIQNLSGCAQWLRLIIRISVQLCNHRNFVIRGRFRVLCVPLRPQSCKLVFTLALFCCKSLYSLVRQSNGLWKLFYWIFKDCSLLNILVKLPPPETPKAVLGVNYPFHMNNGLLHVGVLCVWQITKHFEFKEHYQSSCFIPYTITTCVTSRILTVVHLILAVLFFEASIQYYVNTFSFG